jgi:hypothetical protein
MQDGDFPQAAFKQDTYEARAQAKVKIIEEPEDAYVTKSPAVVRCVVQNAHIAYIECNGKINDFTNQDSVSSCLP